MWLSLPWAYWLGIVLVLWLLMDLVTGKAYIWQSYERRTEPAMYWLTMFIWGLVAASCFIYPNWPYV